jgi:hypothetical protein
MDSRSDFKKFFRFSIGQIEGPLTVAPLNNKDIATSDRKKFFMGDFKNEKPEVFVKVDGNEACDFIIAGAPSFYLVSERVINAMKENDITGWSVYPVTIKTSSMEEIKNYLAFYIIGNADKADRNLSEKIEVTFPNKTKGIKEKGYYFPLNSWEGTDFFYHVGTYGITVTEKVKEFFESLNVTNVKFESCTEYIWA